jgi:hypothetical protein
VQCCCPDEVHNGKWDHGPSLPGEYEVRLPGVKLGVPAHGLLLDEIDQADISMGNELPQMSRR